MLTAERRAKIEGMLKELDDCLNGRIRDHGWDSGPVCRGCDSVMSKLADEVVPELLGLLAAPTVG